MLLINISVYININKYIINNYNITFQFLKFGDHVEYYLNDQLLLITC